MNLKKSKLLKVAISIIVIAILVVCWKATSQVFSSKGEGSITIEVINLDGEKLIEKKIKYFDGDSLVTLIEENFENVNVSDGMIIEIDKLTTPEDWSTFICIYVNGEMSMVGINEIEYADGDVISFIDTVVVY